MDMQTTALIVLWIFLLIPPNNETTAYIQVIGSVISCSILLLNIDWVEVNELVKSYLNECVNWLLIKTDGDRTLAKTYFIMILVIAMQPIILGGFWLLKIYKRILRIYYNARMQQIRLRKLVFYYSRQVKYH